MLALLTFLAGLLVGFLFLAFICMFAWVGSKYDSNDML